MLNDIGVEVNEVLPEGGSVERIKRLPKAWCTIVPYREVGIMAAKYLEESFGIPYVAIPPIGLVDTAACLREVHRICFADSNAQATVDIERYIDRQTRFICQAAWFSRSIDCQNLTGKKAVVFGDATHAAALTRILSREMGLSIICAGTYCTHDADWFREQVQGYCDEVLITDDHSQVNEMITRVEPSAIFGTQMERMLGSDLEFRVV
jgi:light-independent protochlorophyllide reductase subunit B